MPFLTSFMKYERIIFHISLFTSYDFHSLTIHYSLLTNMASPTRIWLRLAQLPGKIHLHWEQPAALLPSHILWDECLYPN